MGNRERRVSYDRDVLGGEGGDEVEFFCHLRSAYSSDQTNPKLRDGRGGNPKHAIKVALRSLPQLGAYRARMMVFDGDRSEDVINDGIKECKECEPEIEYVISDNRFEVEIGKILECSDEIMRKLRSCDRSAVKQTFDEICPPCEKRYEKILPKEVLERKRKDSEWLNVIISFIERAEASE